MTPKEQMAAAAAANQRDIDNIAARLVKGANEYAANLAARSTGNQYAGESVRRWSEYQMRFSSSGDGRGTGVEQARGSRSAGAAGLGADKGMTASKTHPAPNPSTGTPRSAAGLDADKGATSAKTDPGASRAAKAPSPAERTARFASAGLRGPRRTGAAKGTLSSPQARETRAAQQAAHRLSVDVPQAPRRSGAVNSTPSGERSRWERMGQQVALGLRKMLRRGG
ncbi:hypothetical protein LO772_22450 [Yinghuangia sp. ASG 101]|uniref:hypothetical protein n=1 Tax=Yinghuangia sp. ASG 101 TaxID=2896848 RepID=UPI001E41C49B|nr:hypothetical protein [Yinghuangia sp. ASG 101]UGQ09667.1 hypothetical protein LO772_22450 [Yinghuangia sp. ASG 101]